MAVALALDFGGTKLMVGLVAEDGRVLAERTAPTPAAAPDEVVAAVWQMAEQACAEAAAPQGAVKGVGVSFGGPVDYRSGRVITCHHLPGWEGYPLREEIAARSGLPAVVDNDANAAALGEARYGAARGCQHVLYLTVSTGVGGGLILGGRVHRGAHSLAGEIGHVVVDPEGPVCSCGRRGCVEAFASGPAIARAALEAVQAGEESCLASVPAEKLTAREVAAAAATDALAGRILARAGQALGRAIAAAANLLDPEMAVIGGGVAQAGERLLGPVRERIQAEAVPGIASSLRVELAGLGARSALMGAAALCFQELP